MKPTVITFLIGGILGAETLLAQSVTMRDMSPPRVWTSDGWRAVSGDSDSSRSSPVYSGPSAAQIAWQKREDARLERAERAKGISQQARAAMTRGDYEAALKYYLQQQAVIDGPNVRAGIAYARAYIAYNEALAIYDRGDKQAALAKFRQVVTNTPDAFSEDVKNFVRDLGSEVSQQAAAKMMQQSFGEYGATLKATPTTVSFDATTVVDFRNLPPALSKPLEDAIRVAFKDASPENQDRVRKGFQAVMCNDWVAARAWFEYALNNDRTNPALLRLVEAVKPPAPAAGKTNVPPPPAEHPMVESPAKLLREIYNAVADARALKAEEKELFPERDGHAKGAVQVPEEKDLELLFPGYRSTESKIDGNALADARALKAEERYLFPERDGHAAVQVPEESDVELLFLSGKSKTPGPKVVPASRN